MTDPASSEILEQARQLLAGITPGEWFIAEDGTIRATSGTEVCQTYDGADDGFIAAAPHLVRDLLALVAGRQAPAPADQKEEDATRVDRRS